MLSGQHAVDPSSLELAVELLRGVPEICAAYLHGSAARDELRSDSDIDLALLLHPGVEFSPAIRLDLGARLESIFQRPVDLGFLATCKLVFCKEVICSGRILFTRDRLASDLFAAQTLSMYVDLQERRKEVLGAYAA